MAYRKRMSRSRSKKDFRRKSGKNGKNFFTGSMRGGIRL